MLREGPVPVFVHGVVEYVAGVVFIVAPFLLTFESGAATAASIIAGLLVLSVTATSALPTGMVKGVTVGAHVTIDLVLAVILVAAPFLFGYRDEGDATAFFITVGVVHLLLTIATRFPERRPAAGR